MKNIKVWFTTFTLIMVVWFSSMGCVTKSLWKDSKATPYKEKILAFYIQPQKQETIFIGERYHYIFHQGVVDFNKLLQNKENLILNKNNLYINAYTQPDDASVIYADITIRFQELLLNKKQKEWLLAHNFKEQDAYVPMIVKEFSLSGKRYRASREINSKVKRLQEPIKLQVREYSNNTLHKVVMTPLTLTADTGLILAGVVVFPIVWLLN